MFVNNWILDSLSHVHVWINTLFICKKVLQHGSYLHYLGLWHWSRMPLFHTASSVDSLKAPADTPVWGISISYKHFELLWRLSCKPSKQCFYSLKQRMHVMLQVGHARISRFFQTDGISLLGQCWLIESSTGWKDPKLLWLSPYWILGRVSDMNSPMNCAEDECWRELGFKCCKCFCSCDR